MTKNPIEDTFEKLAEQGTTSAKKVVKTAGHQIKQTIDPTRFWEQLLGVDTPSVSNQSEAERLRTGNPNHTPLNFDKLKNSYQDQERQKLDNLRQHLFQLVKKGDEKVQEDKKLDEQDKKRKEAEDDQEKRRKEHEKKAYEQSADIPKGKVRRSIFSHKKVAEKQHTETKPSTGKQ